jgi:hypothetical protein
MVAILNEHDVRRRPAVQKAARMVHRAGIHIEKVSQAARKTPGDVSQRD